ncbi:MAG: hypothetical protein V4672_13050 [Verrucomicrobiota bacterium]
MPIDYSLFKLCVPPLLTVGLGTYMVGYYFVTHSNEAAFIDQIIADLTELRSVSLDYWSQSANENKEAKIQSQRIKGLTLSLSNDIGFIHLRFQTRKRRWIPRYFRVNWKEHGIKLLCWENSPEPDKFTPLLMPIILACSGGDFESKKHKADETVYLRIVNSICDFKAELLALKL